MKVWREILDLTDGYLAKSGVPDARVAAELLAARLLKTGRGFLSPHLDAPVSERHLEAMRRAMARLAKGEPIQYVLGEWDFRSLTLKCDARALIPRPETEELVTRVLAFLKARDTPPTGADHRAVRDIPPAGVDHRAARPPLVVDVGTGTGCIALALAKEFPAAEVIATDISPDAIALAKENAARCGLADRVRFVVADGLDDFDEPACLDAIVSNPPYVPSSVCTTLDPRVRDFEPRNALDGGAAGLDFYERYVADAMNLLKPGGGLFFEIGEGQGESVRTMLFEAGFENIRVERDYAGLERYVSGTLEI